MTNVAEQGLGRQQEERGKARRSGLKTAACLAGGVTLFAVCANRVLDVSLVEVKCNQTTEQVQPADCKGNDIQGLGWIVAAGVGFLSIGAGIGRVTKSIAVDNWDTSNQNNI